MKTLKQIHESFYDNTSSGLDGKIKGIKDRLKVIIKNYDDFVSKKTGELSEECILINPDFTVNVLKSLSRRSTLELSIDEKGIGVQFGIIKVDYIVIEGSKATNFTGLPEYYSGNLRIEHCNNLQYISDNNYGCRNGLFISSCNNLTSIKGMSESMTGSLQINNCKKLTSIDGCARHIGSYFKIDNCGVKSLKGAPITMAPDSSISISNCNIKTTKYIPQGAHKITLKSLDKLTQFESMPQKLASFQCEDCKSLTSLEGSPKEVSGTFQCVNCKSLTSLVGGPEKSYIYICDNNPITNFIGAPEGCELLSFRNCSELESIEGFPKFVKGDFSYKGCNKLKFNESDIKPFVRGKISEYNE